MKTLASAPQSEPINSVIDDLLATYFGWNEFRPLQREVIECVLSGRSALAVLPTGGGKSLCYQLPALALPGLTLVISPLISLMKDQVDALTERKIAAIAVNSQDTVWEMERKLSEIQNGMVRIVFVAPERLKSRAFLDACRRAHVQLMAVDEAHCVSQWGHDFRPDYRFIRDFHQAVGEPPLLALTATATRKVQDDIVDHLGITGSERFLAGVDRPNLWFGFERCATVAEKRGKVAAYVRKATGSCIVYVSSRREADELAVLLETSLNEPVLAYHAGLDFTQRTAAQNRFMAGLVRVVVATNAFGMGIDKADIRAVIHAGVPDSIEAYYQEVGRAGRDGKPAECTLITVSGMDVKLREFLLNKDEPTRDGIESTVSFIKDALSRGNQDVFIPFAREDIATLTLILSHVQTLGHLEIVERTHQGLRIHVTDPSTPWDTREIWALIQDHMRAKRERFGHMKNFVYLSSERCRRTFLIDYFGEERSTSVTHCCSACAPKTVDPLPVIRPKRRDKGSVNNPLMLPVERPLNKKLLEKLKAWRWSQATERGVPSYVIFGDKDLAGIALAAPGSLNELAACRGVGPTKLKLYGEAIVQMVKDVREQFKPDRDLYETTSTLFERGVDVVTVADELGLDHNEIWTTFLHWIVTTKSEVWKEQVRRLLTPREYAVIRAQLRNMSNENATGSWEDLRQLFDNLKIDITRAVMTRVGELNRPG